MSIAPIFSEYLGRPIQNEADQKEHDDYVARSNELREHAEMLKRQEQLSERRERVEAKRKPKDVSADTLLKANVERDKASQEWRDAIRYREAVKAEWDIRLRVMREQACTALDAADKVVKEARERFQALKQK